MCDLIAVLDIALAGILPVDEVLDGPEIRLGFAGERLVAGLPQRLDVGDAVGRQLGQTASKEPGILTR